MLAVILVAGLAIGAILGYTLTPRPDIEATNEQLAGIDDQLTQLMAGMNSLNDSARTGLDSLMNGGTGLDFFFSVTGIEGSSTDAAHQDWIELLSFHWGVGRASSMDIASTFSEFVIYKMFDKSTPKLAEMCCSGEVLNEAVLEAMDGPTKVMEIKLVNVVVTTMKQGSYIEPGDVLPSESISFNFEKIGWEYTPVNAQGAPLAIISGGWNLLTNEPWNP